MTSATLVAVTGAEGFIGSHLVEALVAAGHRVRAMAQYNSFSSLRLAGDAAAPTSWTRWRSSSATSATPARSASLVAGADGVYHLAALIAIPYSYRAPHSLRGHQRRRHPQRAGGRPKLGTPRLVHTSTSETYGTARTVPITEDHPLQAQSPYAASKAGGDKLAESYHLASTCRW